MLSNAEFLKAIFGDSYGRAHCTSFDDDPTDIGQDRRAICWGGHSFDSRKIEGLNQYFTVSLFSGDKRRKHDFEATYVVMLDDVKEKLDFEQAQRLPKPSFILETSRGSEQWGFILKSPETKAHRVDNLHEGLILKGLAPDGKDPGQKGVTRYVRLPEGKNTKKSKRIFGRPFDCRITEWNPSQKYDIEDIAKPFDIDVNVERKDRHVSVCLVDNDHPILEMVDINYKKGIGEYDIRCPWIDSHTNKDNNGSLLFTNEDSTIGFKCHHGHCEDRTAFDLIEEYEALEAINDWKVRDILENHAATTAAPEVKKDLITVLGHTVPGKDRNNLASEILTLAEDYDAIEKIDMQKQVKEVMGWTSAELKSIVSSLKKKETEEDHEFYSQYVFVGEQNKFYNPAKHFWHTTEAFTNIHYGDDTEAKKFALAGKVKKVDRIDYLPEGDEFFKENGLTYANIWRNTPIKHTPGDCSPWFDHFKLLGWDTDHIMKWMAFTIRNPGRKINHGVILGSAEGSGKDWILEPLKRAMAGHHMNVEGEEILTDYNDYLIGTKYLHINEVELGDNRDALRISNKIKRWLTAPPDTMRIREMYAGTYDVRNIVSITMATNSRLPLRLRETSRRLYCLWSNFKTKDPLTGSTHARWIDYWNRLWNWMLDGGWEYCVDYLMKLDISDFNPGAAPPVTDWLREIVSGSENTVVQTLRNVLPGYMANNPSCVITTAEVQAAIESVRRVMPHKVFCDTISTSVTELNMRNMGYTKEGEVWNLNTSPIQLATINK
jgi:hypothetical protein